jgi:hypothetical protein
MAANATAESSVRLPAAKQPPENSVWIRYHPWIEGVMAHISAWSIHLLVIGGAVLWFTYLAYALGFARPSRSLPMAPVRLAVPTGDGQPVGAKAEGRDNAPPKEALPDRNGGEQRNGLSSPIDRPELPSPPKEVIPEFPQSGERAANPGGDTMGAFIELDRQLGEMRKTRSEGNGGTGPVAGTRPGDGPGQKPGAGGEAGSPTATVEQQRMMRWSMRFDTQNGADYLRQLEALGAVLAIPDGANSYKVVDLTKRPLRAEDRDLSAGKRIWWFDKNPQSVAGLMTAMRLSFRPQRIVALIPKDVEEELAKKELETGLKVDDIFETTFGVRVPGVGGRKYDVWVIGQKTNKEMKR